jgi:HD-like signal output (HDOD) protein
MDAIDRIVKEIDRFPTLPDVATASLLELEREECDFDEIASLISLDPVLAARVMKIANSAFFGAAKRADTVVKAICRLGINELRNCLVTVAVMDAIPELPPPHSAKTFWTLSLASALVAQRLAEKLGYLYPDRAYTASLVHLIGDAVLMLRFTGRYRQAIETARVDGIPLGAAVTEQFGCDQAMVSARVLGEWAFPEPIVRAVQRQSLPRHAGDEAFLASLILASDGLCRDRGLGLKDPAYRPRGWVLSLADGFLDVARQHGGPDLGAFLDAFHPELDELIDFALTVF